MPNIHLSIIIPVLNLWPLTKACLQSLGEHTPGRFYEVVVVDNGSTDATTTECAPFGKALFGDRFQYVRLDENRNFGPGCNIGAKAARGDLLFFLNNDTLATPGWFVPLLTAFKQAPSLGAVSPLCLFPDDGRVQHLGIGFDGGLSLKHPYFLFPGDHPVTKRSRRVQALSGAALMLPAALFHSLGGFHEGFVNGLEDVDLCCRVRRKGYRLAQVNESRILHLASQTPGRNNRDADNIALVNKRCAGCFVPDIHTIAQADGFACTLTPWLEMVLVAPKGDQTALPTDTRDCAALRQQLDSYPLWGTGYDLLATALEAKDQPGEAVHTLLAGATLVPSPERYRRLLKLAEDMDDSKTAKHARDKLTTIQTNLSHLHQLRERARSIRDWADETGDTSLRALYNQWLNSIATS